MENFPKELKSVSLYYPNKWRTYVDDLVPEEDKRFNWFLCSKKYRDKNDLYVIEISKGTKFYDDVTGHTLVVPHNEVEVTLLLLEGNVKRLTWDRILKLIKENNYHGVASLKDCDINLEALPRTNPPHPDNSSGMVCQEAEFGFIEGVLEQSKKEGECNIIQYAKQNYKCMRGMFPDFPSPQEIDDVLKEFPPSTVCKVLYEYIRSK
jgi:hypothetical protein